MYCPKCGTQNTDDASFCRGCGVNLSLVPQALTGHLPEQASGGKKGRAKNCNDEPPNLRSAMVRTFVGIAFIMVALSVRNAWQIAGHIWWFWMLIPAAGSLGTGIAEFLRLGSRYDKSRQLPAGNAYIPPAVSAPPLRASELPPRRNHVSDIYTPSSVTENTTKLLDKDQ